MANPRYLLSTALGTLAGSAAAVGLYFGMSGGTSPDALTLSAAHPPTKVVVVVTTCPAGYELRDRSCHPKPRVGPRLPILAPLRSAGSASSVTGSAGRAAAAAPRPARAVPRVEARHTPTPSAHPAPSGHSADDATPTGPGERRDGEPPESPAPEPPEDD